MLSFMQFLKIMMVLDNPTRKLLELIQLYKQIPKEKFFNFHYLPKLYIGFNFSNL